jgi:hypothetical protein
VEAHAACEENPFWCRTTEEKGREEKRREEKQKRREALETSKASPSFNTRTA